MKKKGLSLVELLVTLVIMGFFLPMLYGVLLAVQKSDEVAKKEIELQTDTRRTIDNLVSDIREAVLIYERNSTVNISNLIVPANNPNYQYPSINDTSTNSITRFTLSNSNDNFTNYLNVSQNSSSSPESSALALIKYSNRKCIFDCNGNNPKFVKLYSMIYYYLTLANQSGYYSVSSNQNLRAIIKAVSKKEYFEPTGLTSSEISMLQSQGYVSWTIPKTTPFTLPPRNNGTSPVIDYTDFKYYPMNLHVVSPDVKNIGGTKIGNTEQYEGGVNIPAWGGLRFMQSMDKSLIKITIASALRMPDKKGIRTAVLDTVVKASNIKTN